MLENGMIVDGKYKILNKIRQGRDEHSLPCNE